MTGYVSPQFHVIYDNWFEMVPNTGQGEMIGGVPDNVWYELIETLHDRYVIDEVDEGGNPLPLPPLHPDWLTEEEVDKRRNYETQRRMCWPVQVQDHNRNAAAAPEGAAQQQQDVNQPEEPGCDDDSDDSDGNAPAPGRVTRSGRQSMSGFRESNYDRGQWFTHARKRQGTSFQAMQPPTKVKSVNRNRTKKHYHKGQKIRKQELME
eukprot:scaffold58309_cov49-Attheya_sp.AAC.5